MNNTTSTGHRLGLYAAKVAIVLFAVTMIAPPVAQMVTKEVARTWAEETIATYGEMIQNEFFLNEPMQHGEGRRIAIKAFAMGSNQ